ncbi:MAG: hypothetical protein ACI350_00710 [Prevotella sp.]
MEPRSFSVLACAALLSVACSKSPRQGQSGPEAEMCLERAQEFSARSQTDSALYYLDKGLAVVDGNDTLRAYLYAEKGTALLMSGRPSEAIGWCRKSIELGERLKDDEVLVNQYSTLGICYRRSGYPDSALVAYRHGLAVSKRIDAPDYVANLYNNIAVIYTETDRWNEGISYARLAEQWGVKANDDVERYSALATLASARIRQKRYDEAVRTINPHFIAIVRTGSTPLILKCASPLLKAYVLLGKTGPAHRVMDTVRPYLEQVPPESAGAIGIREIEASMLHAEGRWKEELALWKGLDTVCRINRGIPEEKVFYSQAVCYRNIGAEGMACQLMERAYQAVDSTKNSDVGKQLSEFSVRFRTQEKELRIVRLEKEKAEQRARFLYAVWLLATVVIVLVGVVLYILYRRKLARQSGEILMKRKYIEGLESERARLSKELHDGVCNDLLGLGYLFEGGNAEKGCKELARIRSEVRLISHELMPPRFGKSDLHEILSDYIGHYPLPGCETRLVVCPQDFDWKRVGEHVAYEIYRIVQEYMNNVVKHSKATHVDVRLKAQERLLLELENDGVAEAACPDRKGIGLRTVEDRVRSIGGTCEHIFREGHYLMLLSIPLHDRFSGLNENRY